LGIIESLRHHWPEYGIEAALLGSFMVSACAFGTLLEHPSSPARKAIGSSLGRRALMGLAMGVTAVILIYSPWGQQSGAHMNPATTLAFLWLGKIAPWDAFFYVTAQCVGGILGVTVARFGLREWLKHRAVNYVVTTPGARGATIAWLAELAIAFLMMFMVLSVTNRGSLAPYTGWIAGALLAVYITLEAPLSGMSLNPARSLGSAAVAGVWTGFWIYWTAPLCGMLLASAAYAGLPGMEVKCAKLDHCNSRRCIFRCLYCEPSEPVASSEESRTNSLGR
jgi:aquaporin Z